MGRNTFETLLSFDTRPYNKPLFILSNTLKELPEDLKGKAEIISGGPASVVNRLATRGFANLYVDGGRVGQSFLNLDLVDEMIITRIPVLLGDGIPLFGRMKQRLQFTLKGTEELGPGLVKSHYTRSRS